MITSAIGDSLSRGHALVVVVERDAPPRTRCNSSSPGSCDGHRTLERRVDNPGKPLHYIGADPLGPTSLSITPNYVVASTPACKPQVGGEVPGRGTVSSLPVQVGDNVARKRGELA